MKKIFFPFIILFFVLITSGVFAQPLPPVLVSPVNNATNVPLFPTFIWNASPGATSYELQVIQGVTIVLDQSNITATQFTVVTAVLNYSTSYYWRVRAFNTGGPGAWSQQWNFTTAEAPPGVPTLSTPPNGAINISLTPTLTWGQVTPPATQYRLQVSTSNTFTTTVIDISGLTNTGYTIPPGILNTNTTYYWRVNATNGGGTSNWSTVWSFTTVPAAPLPPSLSTPLNHATGQPVTLTFDWTDAAGATTYELQVSLNNTFTSIVIDQNVSVSTYTVPLGILSGTTQYFWRVNAGNAGGTSNWSSPTWDFTTMVAPPAAPQLYAPPNLSIVGIVNVLLDWNNVATATSYRVQVSTDPNFGTTFINQVTGAQSQYTIVTPMQYNTTYYWRVNATNAGGTGIWSATWSFTTNMAPPVAPSLLLPLNGATNVSLTPYMDWTDVSTASSYRLQISTVANFSSTVLNVVVTSSEYTVPSGILQGNTLYYWHVAGINAGGQGPFSTTRTFTTLQTLLCNLKVYLEGFYNGTTQVQDTIKVYLAQSTTPFTFRDSTTIYLGGDGTGSMSFSRAPNGNYYIAVRHRNHIETWSANIMLFQTNSTVNYDFTTGSGKAYGNNMKQVGSAWVFYGGDANRDGYVDPADYTVYSTQFGLDGYRDADFNGDGFVDGYDSQILYVNFGKSLIRPY